VTNWVETLTGDSRAKLLRLLRRSQQTITALADALHLTDNAVRTHIAALERDGIVAQVGNQRDTGGKPARVYGLTAEGEELFPKAYALVLAELVEEISRAEGRERAVALLSAVGQRVAGSVARSADLKERVTVAAGVLRDLGGDIDVERTDGGYLLKGYACPLSSVSAQHPEVCELARALAEEIVGQPVSECCDRRGRPRCGFKVLTP
jgi:predicted ArsR family transcriptional regulator